MHLERIRISDDDNPAGREMVFTSGANAIHKWMLLNAEKNGAELLRFIVMACATRQESAFLGPMLVGAHRLTVPIQLECVLVRHAPQECGISQAPCRTSGWLLTPEGILTPTSNPKLRLNSAARFSLPPKGRSHTAWLLLAYGKNPQPHLGTDSYQCGPNHRLRRTGSFFNAQEQITDPVAFLKRLHCKGVTYGRPRSRCFLARLNRELAPLFGFHKEAWLERQHDFKFDWERLSNQQQQMLAVIIDAARHMFDASAKLDDPFDQSGVVMLDGLDNWCARPQLTGFMELLDLTFPKLQFFVCLGKTGRVAFPKSLLAKDLSVPEPLALAPKPLPLRLPSETVLLVPVDGSLPNVALMKLSRHFKNQRLRVVLAKPTKAMPDAGAVWASCIFNAEPSVRRVTALRERYGDALHIGGSGVSLRLRLSFEVERLESDYSLYPELGDRAIGFLTRGCPNRCAFCVVPTKEGLPRQVSDFDSLLQGRKKLILLDDNLLAHPAAEELLEEMAHRNLAVNFNQTIDLRRLTPKTAALLRRIECSNVTFTRRNYYFSLNDARGFDALRKRYSLLQTCARDNVAFVCMYGLNTSLAEDVARFQFLRSLPGAYVFLQRYQQISGGPKPDQSHFFDDEAEKHIDALLGVNFTQNMKSMETYYRWVCLLYAQQRGRIHRRLVETLHRYNNRPQMGGFVTKLEALCRKGAPFQELPPA